MKLNRRQFSILLTSAAFVGLTSYEAMAKPTKILGYGDLIQDPNALLDLPSGFQYSVLSKLGDIMIDGVAVPDRADGMGCIPLDDEKVALIRNHELKPRHRLEASDEVLSTLAERSFDTHESGTPIAGGTTTLIYNMKTKRVEEEFVSLIGTIDNCAGGVTPWGSWLSCEEDVTKAGEGVKEDHGWVFEVPATARGVVEPVPLKGLGRFTHEAACVDPNTGIVYLTEDRSDSLFYRFVPDVKGKLDGSGALQVLVFKDTSFTKDSRNWETRAWDVGNWQDVVWVDIDETDSPNDDLRYRGHYEHGAVIFARGEGIHWGDGELYFTCTSGGHKKLGQIMRYRPAKAKTGQAASEVGGSLQIFIESHDPKKFDYGDNLIVAPNGHLIVCEDKYRRGLNKIVGVTPQGEIYDFALLRLPTEPAGVCFSPDGSTLFVNVYSPTRTLAITGPWGAFKR